MDSFIFEASRAGLAAFALLYFYQSLLNARIGQLKGFKSSLKNGGLDRVLFALCSGLFCLLEYSLTFNPTDIEYKRSILAIIYFLAYLGTFYYVRSMRGYYLGGARLKKGVSSLLFITMAFHTTCSVWQIFVDPQFNYMNWVKRPIDNPIIQGLYQNYSYASSDAFNFMTLLYGACLSITLFSMLFGYFKGRYSDKFILCGVVLSLCTLGWEMYASTYHQELFFFIAFAGNLPEVARITFIAQKDLILELGLQTEKAKRLESEKQRQIEKARLRVVASLSKGVAHEVNNPLTVIGISTKILRQALNAGTLSQDVLLKTTMRIDQNIQRIARIIDGLKVVGQTNNRFIPAKQNLNSILDDVRNASSSKLSQYQIELLSVSDKQDGEIDIFCDRNKLTQALLYLVENSIEALAQNDGKWIKIEYHADQDSHLISVTDGANINILEEHEEKIFEPFFSTKTLELGKGLGLTAARGLVEDHGGTLSLCPVSEHTKFNLRFPRVHLDS